MPVFVRVLLLAPLALSLACAGAGSQAPHAPAPASPRPWAELQGDWRELYQHEGKPVLLEYCAADLLTVHVYEHKLMVEWPQEGVDYAILGGQVTSEGWTLQVDSNSHPTIQARRTPLGVRWEIDGRTIDTASESSTLPRMTECCEYPEDDPGSPVQEAIVPKGQPCP